MMSDPGVMIGIGDIWMRRNQILEEFARAYLAHILPPGAGPDWSMENVELV